MFKLALEAMQATAQSKFGRELDALWQSVIDYRDKELQQLDYRVRYKKAKEFFKKNPDYLNYGAAWDIAKDVINFIVR